jgi:hypothetical protein
MLKQYFSKFKVINRSLYRFIGGRFCVKIEKPKVGDKDKYANLEQLLKIEIKDKSVLNGTYDKSKLSEHIDQVKKVYLTSSGTDKKSLQIKYELLSRIAKLMTILVNDLGLPGYIQNSTTRLKSVVEGGKAKEIERLLRSIEIDIDVNIPENFIPAMEDYQTAYSTLLQLNLKGNKTYEKIMILCYYFTNQYNKIRENEFILSYDDKLYDGMGLMKLKKRVTNNLILGDSYLEVNPHMALNFYNEAINSRNKLELLQKDKLVEIKDIRLSELYRRVVSIYANEPDAEKYIELLYTQIDNYMKECDLYNVIETYETLMDLYIREMRNEEALPIANKILDLIDQFEPIAEQLKEDTGLSEKIDIYNILPRELKRIVICCLSTYVESCLPDLAEQSYRQIRGSRYVELITYAFKNYFPGVLKHDIPNLWYSVCSYNYYSLNYDTAIELGEELCTYVKTNEMILDPAFAINLKKEIMVLLITCYHGKGDYKRSNELIDKLLEEFTKTQLGEEKMNVINEMKKVNFDML